MPTLGNALDFSKYEARNIRAHILGTAPAAPVTGQMYYNSGDNTLWWWDGTSWVSARGGVASLPDATTSVKGIIQLAGDLTGTATSPQIAAGVITDAEVSVANKDGAVGTPSMRTLGSGAAQAAPGNDSRFGAASPPNGAAGGDLTGSTYPNPVIANGAVTSAKIADATITDTDVAAANKDGSAGVVSMRSLGTGANQAAAGNDARLSDTRVPVSHKSTHEPGGADPLTVDAAIATGSLRTLGAGAQQAMPGNRSLDAITAPAADLNLNSKKVTNLADPVGAQDGANKQYVDGVAQGLDAKTSVRAASTGNLTLSGTQTVDGIALVANDRVLVKDQSTASQNGIYVVAAGAWARTTDADTWVELVSAFTFVESGTANADSGWVSTVDPGGTINSTAVTWVQFSGAGQITAGAGMTKTGNTLDVGAGAGITVNADSIQVANDGITNAMLANGAVNVGTADITGTLPVANGGTGQTAAKAARETGIGAAGYYSSSAHGAGTTISVPQATHGLRATKGLIVQVQDETTGAIELPDVMVAASGDVAVTYGASVGANSKRITVIG